MNKNSIKERHLLERFSSSLLKNGRKGSGYKVLLESLFFLRQNQNIDKGVLTLLAQKDLSEKIKSREVVRALWAKPALSPSKEGKRAIVKGSSHQSIKKGRNKEEKQQDERSLERNSFFKEIKKEEDRETLKGSSNKTFQKDIALSVAGEKHKTSALFPLYKISLEKNALPTSLNKFICKSCVNNVKPILETRKVRKGRMTYRVPLVTQTARQEGKAVSFLIENAALRRRCVSSLFQKFVETEYSSNFRRDSFSREFVATVAIERKMEKALLNFSSKKKASFLFSLRRLNPYSIKYLLSEEFSDSFSGKGGSVEKKKQWIDLALQNRAYTHYRWW